MSRNGWKTPRMKVSRKKSQAQDLIEHFHITGGTEEKRHALRTILKEHFTLEELDILGDVDFVITNRDSRDAGAYTIEFDIDKKGDLEILKRPKIIFYRSAHVDDLTDHVVVIHEVVHHLRVFDPRRKGVQGRTNINDNVIEDEMGDSDLEEAMTEAETVARQDPWQEQSKSGYYTYLAGDADRAREHDRRVITESGSLNKPLIGLEAFKKTTQHFPNTAIAKLQLTGPAEAVERFFYIKEEGKEGFTVYKSFDPEGHSSLAQVKRTFPRARSIYEIKDGKPIYASGHRDVEA